MRLIASLGILACFWSSAAPAASILVESTSQDSVGKSLIYEIKNRIGASSIHKLVYDRSDAGFVINIVTVKNNDGRQTSYAATLLMPPPDGKGFDYYVTSSAGFCGSDVTEKCAASILAAFDGNISEIAAAVSEAMKDQK